MTGRHPAGARRRPRGGRPVAAVATALAAAVVATGCSSATPASTPAVSIINPTASTAVTAPPPTAAPGRAAGVGSTPAGTVPTVFDCGGGAYEPVVLLVSCGDAATTPITKVTGARWSAWGPTSATGVGTVTFATGGHTVGAGASLVLGSVVETENGPQFSSLTVTWTGSSPDGHPTDHFAVTTAAR